MDLPSLDVAQMDLNIIFLNTCFDVAAMDLTSLKYESKTFRIHLTESLYPEAGVSMPETGILYSVFRSPLPIPYSVAQCRFRIP